MNQDILKHNQKRKIEIQVLEYQVKLEEENAISRMLSEQDILRKVEEYRLELLLLYERHLVDSEKRKEREADIKEEENERFKRAFGITSTKSNESIGKSKDKITDIDKVQPSAQTHKAAEDGIQRDQPCSENDYSLSSLSDSDSV